MIEVSDCCTKDVGRRERATATFERFIGLDAHDGARLEFGDMATIKH